MKRFYSLILLMVLAVCSAHADSITDKSELSNQKAYTITSYRGFLQHITDGTCIYASTGTASGIVTTADATDEKQQFAILTGGSVYFLYNVGAGKFVNNDGSYTDELTNSTIIYVANTGDDDYPINLNWGAGYYLNTQESGSFEKGYIIDSWDTMDDGNMFKVEEAADVDLTDAITKVQAFENNIIQATVTYNYLVDGQVVYSYVSVTKGQAPLTVEYDSPATRLGATCEDTAPDSKEITASTSETVNYTYTLDPDAIPFTPTTIVDGQFAEGTEWYYLQPGSTTGYIYTDSEGNALYKKNVVHPIDLSCMFAFVGNPISGFQIYNYKTGTTKQAYGPIVNMTSQAVSFQENSETSFGLEEGTGDDQYRFNVTSNADSYLSEYNEKMTVYTWNYYAQIDEYAQYYITAVSTDELEQAKKGVLSFYISEPVDGTVKHNDEGIDAVTVAFDLDATGDTNITIAEGMEEGKISFVDASGNVVATPAYALDEGEAGTFDIVFDSEFNTPGKYTLIIPAGVLKGDVSGCPNQEIRLSYTFYATFVEKTVTGRIWKSMSIDGYTYTNWSTLPYTTHSDGDYYTVKVRMTSDDAFEIIDWEGTGDETNILSVTFDPAQYYKNVLTINGNNPDSYDSWYITTKKITDWGWNYFYAYNDNYSWAIEESNYCQFVLDCYSWDAYAYRYVICDWYIDDSYAYQTLDGIIYNHAFLDKGYNDTDCPAFHQLPYGDDGKYSVKVQILADNEINIVKYDGINNLMLDFDATSSLGENSVTKVNGLEQDEYGTAWVASSVLDGVYDGWYCYCNGTALYGSEAAYDAENKKGYAVLAGVDYSTGSADGDTRYIYLSIGGYEPTLDGTSYKKGDVNEDGVVDISDVNAVLGHMNGTATFKHADVNGDGSVDISDVNAVLTAMLENS